MALKGLKVLELAGLAPAPVCGMILADFGAKVTRVDRLGAGHLNYDVTARGKQSISIDLKKKEGVQVLRKLCLNHDVLIEPFRPGVMEKLGLGPDNLTQENPKLIYARLTGFGQTGPYKHMAGHDINYLALSGVLSSLGRKGENPYAPINLLADFAGGSFVCAMGIMAALLERSVSGKGQVIDSCMVEGAAYVSSWLFASRDMFVWGKPRGENFLDTGHHFYETYKTKDDKYMSVGALEPHFYSVLLDKLSLTDEELPQFDDPDEMKKKLGRIFSTKTQKEWSDIFDGSDSCVTPVLEKEDTADHPQNKFRGSFLPGGMPRPAPLLSRTPAIPATLECSVVAGADTRSVLLENGYTGSEIDTLLLQGVVETPDKSKL
ncbi:alpha-methylacyl-CoA racemase [Eurytemora carolleeae]|uniref:alpha-methylacyl-CoA racemase n=1 Tax=Eurytemora carolleeae TaxID=1294199 RepID=UPI000C76C3D8|nr:alpha-methylacyl-CoA racemase [Eurytemora carolleeae]|eukprot:XP_023335153.1 alpha-methylacyl-CoA racemase-like [Eurytemora affinis]